MAKTSTATHAGRQDRGKARVYSRSVGLTKLEYFAGLAMQALIERGANESEASKRAVEYANYLIDELDATDDLHR